MSESIVPDQAGACEPAAVPTVVNAAAPSKVLEYRAQRVVTTLQLAEALDCATSNIRKNFKSNRPWFVDGVDFFKLEGEELRAFKEQVTEGNLAPKSASHLHLWTESGVLNHVKLVNNSRGWEAYNKLKRVYFATRDGALGLTEAQVSALVQAEVSRATEACQSRLAALEAKVATVVEPEYFTVAGYAKLIGEKIDKPTAQQLGKWAKAWSKRAGLKCGTLPDGRWGTVNTYHTSILKLVFEELEARDSRFAQLDELRASVHQWSGKPADPLKAVPHGVRRRPARV